MQIIYTQRIVCFLNLLPVVSLADDFDEHSFRRNVVGNEKKIELELSKGFGTRVFGGSKQHDFTLLGIRFEKPCLPHRYRILNNIHWNVSFFGGFQHHSKEAYLFAVNPGFRRYFIPVNGKFRPFLEASAGVMVTDIGKPDLGSKFQFNQQVGLGLEYVLTSSSSIKGSYRLLHISNAGLKQPNVGINANLFSLSWSKSF